MADTDAPTATCTRCGRPFAVPRRLREQYPDWNPPLCRSCYQQGGNPTATGGSGRPSARPSTTTSGPAPGATPGATERRPSVGRSGAGSQSTGGAPPTRSRRKRRSGGQVEEVLNLAEVLERYTGGPSDGVFTDGSAHPNPGPGGWGAVLVRNGEVVEQRHGAEPDTTNNRMELTALIAGFSMVPDGESATVYTDSRLCVDTITKWAAAWKRNGWKRRSGPVQNLDLVKRLYALAEDRPEITLQWIKAHDGSRWNEYADALSTAYRRNEL